MPGSTTKKVIVVRFDRDPATGYASPEEFLQPTHIDILRADGSMLEIPLSDAKLVCFVKSWEEPTGLERSAFVSRPKSEGLWVEMAFRDGSRLEALVANRLLDLNGNGLFGSPPDAAGNTQRIFVPRSALTGCSVLGVVGAAKRSLRKKPASEGQLTMFE